MDYEELLIMAEEEDGLLVKEKPLIGSDGIIKGDRVAIRRTIKSYKRKSEVLAEEICHKRYTVGNILKYSGENRKQELIARAAAYRMKITFDQLIHASERGIRSRWELAEYLDCTEEFLQDALERYHQKYGRGVRYKDYYIYFEPSFAIVKLI